MKKLMALLLTLTSFAVSIVEYTSRTKLPRGTVAVSDTGVVGPKILSDMSSNLIQISVPSFTISDSGNYAVSVLNQSTGVRGTINLAQLGNYRLALVPGGSSFTAPGSLINVINKKIQLDPGTYTVDKKTGLFVANPSEVTQYSLAKIGKNTIVLTKTDEAANVLAPGLQTPVTSQVKIGGGAVTAPVILGKKTGVVYR